MDRAMRLSIVVSIIMFVISASCSRVPEDSQQPSSGESDSANANSSPAAQPSLLPETSTAQTIYSGSEPRNVAHFWGSEIDLNSGDVRGPVPAADGSLQYGIHESDLSKEVRRLGIPIPDQREWVPTAGAQMGGAYVDFVYGPLPQALSRLLDLLDEVNATDAERRTVLEKLMVSMRTDKPHDAIDNAYTLTEEVMNQQGSVEAEAGRVPVIPAKPGGE